MPDAVSGATMTDVRAFGTLADPIQAAAAAPLNANSGLAYAANLIVKATAGILYGFAGYSSNSSAQFILVFDTKAVPAAGAAPALVITVPATGNFSYNPGPYGRAFKNGIVIANSSTAPLFAAGTTDTFIDVQYR